MSVPDPIKNNHVTILGNLDAQRAIIFVHGFGTEQSIWHETASAFKRDFKLIFFDNMGAGKSDPDAFIQHHYLNLHAYASDLLAICKKLDLKQAIVVGHSAGAMISALAVIKNPAYFSKLVMIAASPRYLNDEGYYGGLTRSDLANIYKTISESFSKWVDTFSASAMATPYKPELVQYFADTLISIPQERVLTVLCSILQTDYRSDIALLNIPTLIIQSQEDVFVPLEVAQFLNKNIKYSRLEVINAVGHLPHLSAPGEVIKAMKEFID